MPLPKILRDSKICLHLYPTRHREQTQLHFPHVRGPCILIVINLYKIHFQLLKERLIGHMKNSYTYSLCGSIKNVMYITFFAFVIAFFINLHEEGDAYPISLQTCAFTTWSKKLWIFHLVSLYHFVLYFV